jgi:hypothetical protein
MTARGAIAMISTIEHRNCVPRQRLVELMALLTGGRQMQHHTYIAEKIEDVLRAPAVPLSLDAANQERVDRWLANEADKLRPMSEAVAELRRLAVARLDYLDGVDGECEHGVDWHQSCDKCVNENG